MAASTVLDISKSTDILKGPGLGEGVDEDDAGGPLVVGLGDVPEAFLAGSVPDLQFEALFLDGDGLDLEVDADGGDVAGLEGVLAETHQHIGLAHPAVPDYYQLQRVVLLLPLHLYYHQMRAKKEKHANQLRQQNRQHIRQQLRSNLMRQMENEHDTLISTTLQLFWDLTHAQLFDCREKLIEVLHSTNFQVLSDEEHYFLVTDLFYLVHERVIPEPHFIRFKKNQDVNTASLVAFLSNEIPGEELAYWIGYMNDDHLILMYTMIEGVDETHKKWVLNQPLFTALLKHTQHFTEAAIAFKSILTESDELTKKQIDQSLPHIHKALQASRDDQNESLRTVLLSIWMTILRIYQKLKQPANRVEFMTTVLKHELAHSVLVFLDLDVLSDLNQLYAQQLAIYLPELQTGESMLQCVYSRITEDPTRAQGEEPDYFFNTMFRLLYNDWLSRQAECKEFVFGKRFYELLGEMSEIGREKVWFLKLRRAVNWEGRMGV